MFLLDLKQFKCDVLQVAHSGETWALARHPTLPLAVTAGLRSKDIRMWNTELRQPLFGRVVFTELPAYSLCFSPSGDLLGVGCSEGVVMVYTFPSLQVVYEKRISKVKN
jgi:hypothetical protein